jgi:hypothetical protein
MMKAMMKEIREHGPVTACFDVHESFYDFFDMEPYGV